MWRKISPGKADRKGAPRPRVNKKVKTMSSRASAMLGSPVRARKNDGRLSGASKKKIIQKEKPRDRRRFREQAGKRSESLRERTQEFD